MEKQDIITAIFVMIITLVAGCTYPVEPVPLPEPEYTIIGTWTHLEKSITLTFEHGSYTVKHTSITGTGQWWSDPDLKDVYHVLDNLCREKEGIYNMVPNADSLTVRAMSDSCNRTEWWVGTWKRIEEK